MASAATIGFQRITSNAPNDIAGNLGVNVVDLGAGQVLFLFTNTDVTAASFINQIYVEDTTGALSSFAFSAADSFGNVVYSGSPNPTNPPGISPFVVAFSAGANNPAPQRGISATEGGGFTASTSSFALVTAALDNGDLRFAMHVQGIGPNSQSDGYLSLPTSDPPLPEPSTGLLGALGLLLLLRRRRK